MRRLILVLLALGLVLAMPGCAKKAGAAAGNATINVSVPPSSPAPSGQQFPAGQGTQEPGQAAQQNATNLSADEQLKKGLGMFDYTVDPLLSGSGYDGTVQK